MTDFVSFILNPLVLHLGREIRNGFADAKKNLYPSFGEFSLQINKRLGLRWHLLITNWYGSLCDAVNIG